MRTGIRARILETLVMLILLALLILGIVWVASALIDNDAASMESLYVCTPVGLSRMFTVMGQLLVKPTILEDLDEQMYIITLEEEAIQRKLNGVSSTVEYQTVELERELEKVRSKKTNLERRKKASAWERNLVYPAVMILLLTETSFSVLLVALNILYLLVDETAMPKGSGGPGIGNASLSTFGFVGAALEIILIFYLMVSSVVGFYSLRFFENFTPRKDDTTMTKIIGNCVSILVLSSALPVMSRTLGITRFDLLGDFGRFNWLGNFYIVLSYNLLFAIMTTLCLVRKFTSAVREELLKALGLDKLHLSNNPRDPETKPSANGHQKTLASMSWAITSTEQEQFLLRSTQASGKTLKFLFRTNFRALTVPTPSAGFCRQMRGWMRNSELHWQCCVLKSTADIVTLKYAFGLEDDVLMQSFVTACRTQVPLEHQWWEGWAAHTGREELLQQVLGRRDMGRDPGDVSSPGCEGTAPLVSEGKELVWPLGALGWCHCRVAPAGFLLCCGVCREISLSG
ncbi:hypothetical protein EK904_008059, partial [Melospiza melodia maxima]